MKRINLVLAILLVLVLGITCLVACNKDNETPVPELSEAEKAIAASNAEETELEFIYVSDTHFMREEEVGDDSYPSLVAREKSSQKMNPISEALFSQFCDDVIASGVDFLFIGGDINETGSKEGHIEIAAELQRVEDAGVTVYVINGNHDCNISGQIYTADGTTLDDGTNQYTVTRNKDFASIYANFGYTGTNRYQADNDNLEFTGSLSYTVDLNSKYTLIALDNCSGHTHDYDANPEKEVLEWTIKQVADTVAAGKTPILLMHRPLTEIFTGVTNLFNLTISGEFVKDASSTLKGNDDFATALYKAGLRYTFVGHMHSADVMLTDYNEDDANPGILQVMNNSVTGYSCNYYDVKFKQSYVDLTLKYLGAPKEEYLPAYLSEEDKTEILTNFKDYAYDYTSSGFGYKVRDAKIIIRPVIAEYLTGVKYSEMTSEQQTKYNDFLSGLFAYLDRPLYTKDKVGDQTSVEELFAKYGFTGTLPASDYKTVLEVVEEVMSRNFAAGDLDTYLDDTQWQLIKYGIYGVVATIVDLDLFGLLAYFDVMDEANNVNCDAMVTKLLNEGVLDLKTYGTLQTIVGLPIISDLLGSVDFLRSYATSLSSDVWGALGGLLKAVGVLIGFDLLPVFGIDEAATADYLAEHPDKNSATAKIFLDGTINLSELLDEFLYGYLGDGLFYDSLSKTQNIVFNRTTGVAYDK